jgi:hypothetical protein
MKAYNREQQERMASFLLEAFLNVYENQEVMRKNLVGLLDILVDFGLSPVEVEQLKDGYVTTGLVGKLFGVTSDTVAYWCDSGKIAAVKTPGNHRRMKIEDAVAYIAKTKRDLFRAHAKKVEVEHKAQDAKRGENKMGHDLGQSGADLNSDLENLEQIRDNDESSRSTGENRVSKDTLSTTIDQELGNAPGEESEEESLIESLGKMCISCLARTEGKSCFGVTPGDECINGSGPQYAKGVAPSGVEGVGFSTLKPQAQNDGSFGRARMHSNDGKPEAKVHTGESPAELPTAEWLTGKQVKAILHIEDNGLESLRKNNSVEIQEIPIGNTKRIMYKRDSVLLLRGTDIVKSKTVHPRTNEFIRWYSGRYREITGQSMPTTEATGGIAKRLVSQYDYEELRAASLLFLMVARSTEAEDEFLRKQGFTLQKLQSALPSMQSRLSTRVQSMIGNYLYSNASAPVEDMTNADTELETLERRLAFNQAEAQKTK